MIAVTKESGQIKYTVNEYIMDSANDLQNLPKNVAAGSSAIDLSTGTKYVFTNNKQWLPQ